MIRLSGYMLASSLLQANVQSHKREPSSERLLPGSGAVNACQAKGIADADAGPASDMVFT
jgi:hypothetical protein